MNRCMYMIIMVISTIVAPVGAMKDICLSKKTMYMRS